MKFTAKTLLLVAAIVFTGISAHAQSAPDDLDNQSWNDLQLTVPMTKHIDFTTMATARIGNDVTQLVDGRYLFGFVLKPSKSLSITPFWWFIDARNTRGQFRKEHQLNLRALYKFPTKGFGLSHRSQYEYRMREPANSWRYRAHMTIDKDLPKSWAPNTKVFTWDEIFYDSVTKRFSRNRFAAGISHVFNKVFSVDAYYMHQNDGFSHPGDLNVFWIAMKLRP